ncbi:MAG: hypothetical protein Q4D41_12940 [Prevotellaceae bacterium]|nr:hypothetical protein [Prevotellaceae bacterium]
MKHPRLRDSKKLVTNEIYPINEMPDDIVMRIGGYLVYLLYIGRKDITGSDWGDAFADAIGGKHLDSPVGIADVVFDKMAWSMKTVKNQRPFEAHNVRLISGRCSPDYSYGISDPHADIQKTGRAVLGIWNERINIAQDNYNPVRTTVLIRSNDMLNYCLFEEENHRFRTSDYEWEVNTNGNLIGKDVNSGETCFTWQPHGSQFTIHTRVPEDAIKFTVKQPPLLTKEDILKTIEFDSSWVNILKNV